MPSKQNTLFPLLLLGGAALFLAGCQGNLFDQVNNFWSLGCCGSVVVILDIIALVELAGSTRPTKNKILWGLLIVLTPLLGCILYYLFGRE